MAREGDGIWRERVDQSRAGERTPEGRDDDSSRQVVFAGERFRDGTLVDEGCREGVCENYAELVRAPYISREQVLAIARESGTKGKVPMWDEKKALAYLKNIEIVAKHMPIVLGCHCKGKGRCHAETVKNLLEAA